jgi:hypothetical protein
LRRNPSRFRNNDIEPGVILCAVVGMPLATMAAGIGFWLAYHEMLEITGP